MFGEIHDLAHELPEFQQRIQELKTTNSHFAKLLEEHDAVDRHILRCETEEEVHAGVTAYRCCYLYNAHDTDPFDSVSLTISAQPNGPDNLLVGLDPAGTGNGSSTGVAVLIPSESTPPNPAVIFSQPNSIETALNLGPLEAGQARAVWLQRVVPGQILTSLSVDCASLAFGVEYRVPA